MKKIITLLFIFCCFPVSSPCLGNSVNFSGLVYWVIDGDTIKVIGEHFRLRTIRLYGIDCPEKEQNNGWWARVYMVKNCLFRKVKVKAVDRDQYNRIVGKIRVNDRDLNRCLVANGFAWVYDHYCKQQRYCQKLYKAETIARREGKGIWSEKDPIPPWEWRHSDQRAAWWKFW
ncbi:MAG TPA: thermonuclease family protein [Desulfohalobiaceae bacterium]|nr:thermonuclease family protein [Desulfohalobiaceae bacterium]